MKIKEIRLETVKIYKNDEELYDGPVENAPQDLLESEVQNIHFDASIINIEV